MSAVRNDSRYEATMSAVKLTRPPSRHCVGLCRLSGHRDGPLYSVGRPCTVLARVFRLHLQPYRVCSVIRPIVFIYNLKLGLYVFDNKPIVDLNVVQAAEMEHVRWQSQYVLDREESCRFDEGTDADYVSDTSVSSIFTTGT